MKGRAPVGIQAMGVLVLGGFTMLPILGCRADADSTAEKFAGDHGKNSKPDDKPANEEPRKVQFAEDRGQTDLKEVPFDGKRAVQYVRDICAIGTRISGSEGMKKQRELLIKHFEKHGAKVVQQKFDGRQPSQPDAVPMVNLIVTWNPEAKRRIILCGHYDTRPIADQEARERDWRKPFASANDGTSTVAFLMELAHHMKDVPMKVGVDFVIFDGEEYINDNKRDRFFLGSIHFAEQYKKEKPPYQYIAAVLLDLFAHKDATFYVEQNSRFLAGEVVESVWAEARKQGVKSFVFELGHEVQDDHLALNRVGIPAIDIIDMRYAHWHKLSDTPEQCSADKMAEVAKVLTAWMQKIK